MTKLHFVIFAWYVYFCVLCLIVVQLPKPKLNTVALVHERTIPTERPPLVGEVSANFCG
jgi:hypothetical protein